MSNSLRLQIINNIATRLEAIKISSGFNTDAGLNVNLGVVTDEDDNELAIFVYGGEEISDPINGSIYAKQNIMEIIIQAQADYEEQEKSSTLMREELLEDIKKAVELQNDLNMGGLCIKTVYQKLITQPPEPDSNHVNLNLYYGVIYREVYGQPTNNLQ